MPEIALTRRVVEVLAELGEGHDPPYRVGSGCIVAGRTVLTAAHVVADAVRVRVRDPRKVVQEATVDPAFLGDVGGPGPDLALVQITDPNAEELPPMGLAAVDRDSASGDPVERCHVVGYPAFMERRAADGGRIRETVDAVGHVPVLSGLAGGLLTVQVTNTPQPLPPTETKLGRSEWAGLSGAPVVAGGLLLAVVTEHAPRAGPSAITATPLTALEADPARPLWGSGVTDSSAWWVRLGVPGVQALRKLPHRAHAVTAPVALAQLPALAAGFTGRDGELAMLAGLLDTDASVLAVAGLAGVGKTTLVTAAGHAARDRSKFPGGTLFIDLHGYDEYPAAPAQALEALLYALGTSGEDVPLDVDSRAGFCGYFRLPSAVRRHRGRPVPTAAIKSGPWPSRRVRGPSSPSPCRGAPIA